MNDDKEQSSIQLRALLAFALSAVVLFVYSKYIAKPPEPTPKPATVSESVNVPVVTPPTAKTSARSAAAPAGAEAADADQTFVVETDRYVVALSNRGAVVTSWTLKEYTDDAGRPLELVNKEAAPATGYPFGVQVRENPPAVDVNQALFRVEGAAPGKLSAPATLTFRWSDGNLRAQKTFKFLPNSYVVGVESELTQDTNRIPHLLTWRGGFGDAAVPNAAQSVKAFYFDPATGKLEKVEAKAASKGPALNAGNYQFAGIEDLYFAAIFMPVETGLTLQLETTATEVVTSVDKNKQLFAGAAAGMVGENRFEVFVGPKKLDLLRGVRPYLQQVVDFGFFSFIAYPLFLMLTWVHRYVPNFGWSIVVLTVVINFVLFPLKLKSMKSMKKMQKLQPLIKHINDKYKGMSMRDPRRQEQNKEVMDLYSKYGVNPLGGCLPIALQMPFLFAFYSVLTNSIEMRHAGWLWVSDLSSPEHLTIRILPILLIATQFIQQKMTPSTTTDPAQQKMMQFMPVMMGFFFWGVSSGLALYWVTSNLVGMLQQWFINRLPEPDLDLEMNRKGRPKKAKS